MSIGTLKYLAKTDNPEAYAALVYKFTKNFIDKSLHGSHTDIAKALHEIYGDQFIIISSTTGDSTPAVYNLTL